MNVQHKKVFWRINILLLIIVIGSLWMEHKHEQEYTKQIHQVEKKANVYETKIKEIKNEINMKQREINKANRRAWVLPCFVVRTTLELEQADKWIEKYKIPASFVVPSDITEEDRMNIFDEMERKYINRNDIDIMLSGNLSEKEVWNYILDSKYQIQENELNFSDFWCFEAGEDTEENVKQLFEKGFMGYSQITTYGKTLISGEEKNGMLYVEYVPVKQGDNKIKSTLELCKQQNNAAVISFDMKTLNQLEEKGTTELIKEVMELIQTKSKTVSIYNASQMIKRNGYLKKKLKKEQAKYEKYVKKENKKIIELEEKSAKVWEKCSFDGEY
nr:hypothetical protein [uncultured Anaerobutyricum sp.]